MEQLDNMPIYNINHIKSLIILLVTAFHLISCAQSIPSSARSKKVIEEQKPILEAELKSKGLKIGSPVFIRIFKSTMELEVWIQTDSVFEHFKTYTICTYGNMAWVQNSGKAMEWLPKVSIL